MGDFELVRLRNGACSVRSMTDAETYHPGVGPVLEAEALYVRQLRLPERVRNATSGSPQFVVWDVGLGAAANALVAIRSVQEAVTACSGQRSLRMVSFDHSMDALRFAVQHSAELGYLRGFEPILSELISHRAAEFSEGTLHVSWTVELSDFPTSLSKAAMDTEPRPHAIMFDPHSPKKNPAMWTVSVFEGLFRCLDPERPCTLATFSRSTLVRTAMLLGGFFVGTGHPTGLKEETTMAANRIEELEEPLPASWLERAMRSDSAEPLWVSQYHRSALKAGTLERLRGHPQFKAR